MFLINLIKIYIFLNALLHRYLLYGGINKIVKKQLFKGFFYSYFKINHFPALYPVDNLEIKNGIEQFFLVKLDKIIILLKPVVTFAAYKSIYRKKLFNLFFSFCLTINLA